ncbi:MAG: sulfotransferase, partial [Pseudomonadota bacterium]
MAHPLSGADLGTLARAFNQGGWPDRWLPAAGIWAAALFRTPFSLAEGAYADAVLPPLKDIEPPIFIIGHWRSGTTHLYNILGHSGLGFVPPVPVGLPWDMLGLGAALRPLLERALPETRWIDSVAVTPTSPQEDEIGLASMSPLSFYHGIYFPRRFKELIDRGLFQDGCTPAEIAAWERRFTLFLRKISYQQGRPLIIKNPVYTGRVDQIRRLFPDARFIFMHRDPVAVFVSMRNFYKRLLDVMALQDVPDALNIDETIYCVYDRMMGAYVKSRKGLDHRHLIEISYDELAASPLDVISRIYQDFDLGDFARQLPAFEAYIESVSKYRTNAFARETEL